MINFKAVAVIMALVGSIGIGIGLFGFIKYICGTNFYAMSAVIGFILFLVGLAMFEEI